MPFELTSHHELKMRTFLFGHADGNSIGVITLGLDGEVFGYPNKDVCFWSISDDCLEFRDKDNVVTACFNHAVRYDAKFAFMGEFSSPELGTNCTLLELADGQSLWAKRQRAVMS